MRGKAEPGFVLWVTSGITPAYAGKRFYEPLRAVTIWDHPRVCGEKWRKAVKTEQLTGSPPRMRGKVLPRAVLGPASGITPAYAGKSG